MNIPMNSTALGIPALAIAMSLTACIVPDQVLAQQLVQSSQGGWVRVCEDVTATKGQGGRRRREATESA